MIQGIA